MTEISRERFAARVLLLDHDGRVLVCKGHDVDKPERQWWFTLGGGIEPEENARQAACREILEETGIVVTADQLAGPVGTRSSVFDFDAEHVLQHEVFFYAVISSDVELSQEGWTEVEKSFVDGFSWLTPTELANAGIEVFPNQLPEIVANLKDGWDGTQWNLGLEETRAHIGA